MMRALFGTKAVCVNCVCVLVETHTRRSAVCILASMGVQWIVNTIINLTCGVKRRGYYLFQL